MRFQVQRTSSFGDDAPCEEAFRGMTQVWDLRSSKTPEAFDEKVGRRTGDLWFSRGTEHTVVPGRGIKRRFPDRETWFVEVDGLDGLLALWRKYGDLVITDSWADKVSPMIEIYDGYRE
jgi:hypothetical protein